MKCDNQGRIKGLLLIWHFKNIISVKGFYIELNDMISRYLSGMARYHAFFFTNIYSWIWCFFLKKMPKMADWLVVGRNTVVFFCRVWLFCVLHFKNIISVKGFYIELNDMISRYLSGMARYHAFIWRVARYYAFIWRKKNYWIWCFLKKMQVLQRDIFFTGIWQ